MITLTPVLERWAADCPFWPAEQTDFYIAVPGRPTSQQVGTVVWALIGRSATADDLSIIATNAAEAIERFLTCDDEDFAPGGLRLGDDDVVIDPGCCVGLDEWRFLQGQSSTRTNHTSTSRATPCRSFWSAPIWRIPGHGRGPAPADQSASGHLTGLDRPAMTENPVQPDVVAGGPEVANIQSGGKGLEQARQVLRRGRRPGRRRPVKCRSA
jgi:hypothetical protein